MGTLKEEYDKIYGVGRFAIRSTGAQLSQAVRQVTEGDSLGRTPALATSEGEFESPLPTQQRDSSVLERRSEPEVAGSNPALAPNICPSCGLDRSLIKSMLAEPPEWDTGTEHPWGLIESQNHRQAVALLDNCWQCKGRQ